MMTRTRAAIDVLCTILVAVAAAVLLWRNILPQERSEPVPKVERVEAANIKTDIVDAVTRGDPKATVVMIEYSDFECPFCEKYAHSTFDRIDQDFVSTGLVQYAFRNFPLENIHPAANNAARAAECAAREGRFWQMREQLFSKRDTLAQMSWTELATSVGLEGTGFDRCFEGPESRTKIMAQIEHAKALGISSTPTFLLGLREQKGLIHIVTRLPGALPYDVFRRELNAVITAHAQQSIKAS